MLVVDRVVRDRLDEVSQVRRLDYEPPVSIEKDSGAADEVDDVRDVGQHVGPDHDPSQPESISDRTCGRLPEELAQGGEAISNGLLGDVSRRLHAENVRHVALDRAEEGAVV